MRQVRRADPAHRARWQINLLVPEVPEEMTSRHNPRVGRIIAPMKIKVVVHDAEEGGYWAEVPAIPGCATQGETFEELLRNLYEAVEGCLSVDVSHHEAAARNDLSTTRPCDCS